MLRGGKVTIGLLPVAIHPYAVSQTGLLKIDDTFYSCRVSDMTRTGARLRLDHLVDLPQKFSLQLTRDAKVLRCCFLIWQEGQDASVSFDEVPRC